MRQALFDEFQQIEWQARAEAIRERLDDQRRERQEQEEAQEQAEREAAAQHEQEADRQAAQDNRRVKMALALQWHGDRLLPGEHCESHLIEFRNVIGLDDTGSCRSRFWVEKARRKHQNKNLFFGAMFFFAQVHTV